MGGGDEAIAALTSRVDRVRWFPDLESAQTLCADLGNGVQCACLRVDPISRVDAMHRVSIRKRLAATLLHEAAHAWGDNAHPNGLNGDGVYTNPYFRRLNPTALDSLTCLR